MAEIFDAAAGMVRTLATEQQNEETYQAAIDKVNSEIGEPNKKRVQVRGKRIRSDEAKEKIAEAVRAKYTIKRKAVCVKALGYWEKNLKVAKAVKEDTTKIDAGVGRLETAVQALKDGQIKMENLVTDGITRLIEHQNARFGPPVDVANLTPDEKVGAMKELYAQAGTELQRAKNEKAAYIEQQRERIAKE